MHAGCGTFCMYAGCGTFCMHAGCGTFCMRARCGTFCMHASCWTFCILLEPSLLSVPRPRPNGPLSKLTEKMHLEAKSTKELTTVRDAFKFLESWTPGVLTFEPCP